MTRFKGDDEQKNVGDIAPRLGENAMKSIDDIVQHLRDDTLMTVGDIVKQLTVDGLRRPDGLPFPEWRIRRLLDSSESTIRLYRLGPWRAIRNNDYFQVIELLRRTRHLS